MNIQILTGLITLGGLGVVFGAILAIAAKIFFVQRDPRIELINEILPQANCGGCGYPGCLSYAEAIVNDGADITLCAPGGESVVNKIAEIMGVQAIATESKVAVVQCAGAKDKAKDKYVYEGVLSCQAATLIHGGQKACVYGCLGFGDCVKSCPFDAMEMLPNGLPTVFEDKCTGCGICVEACPKGIMALIPRSQKVYVACVNKDRGKAVTEVCTAGCTGCTLCSLPKYTPSGKVKMQDNLPVIPPDWEDYKVAVSKCPTHVLIVREVEKKVIESIGMEEEAVQSEQ